MCGWRRPPRSKSDRNRTLGEEERRAGAGQRPSRSAAAGGRPADVARAADPRARVVLFGHIAEGSIHVNLLGVEDDDVPATDAVLGLVASLGGSISAEHGIGIAKTPWLPLGRSATDIAAMRMIKGALDPAGVLNPRVIFGRAMRE